MIAAIIQTRMSSASFSGRVLETIDGRTMLWHVIDRVKQARCIHQMIVATTEGAEDDAVVRACEEDGIAYFRGSETDVLDRFYNAAKSMGCDVIARFKADCPLIDPRIIDKVIGRYLKGDCDYVANDLQPTYPEGLEVEVFSFGALETAWSRSRDAAEREKVTAYLRTAHRFRRANVAYQGNPRLDRMCWRIRTPEDLVFVRLMFAQFAKDPFDTDDILKLLTSRPEIEVPMRAEIIV